MPSFPSPSIKALLLACLLHATTTAALSLSEFEPKAQDLTPDCQAVYTSNVDGCSTDDFNGNPCSDTCIAGLASIQNSIVSACQADKQNDNNQIIGWMLSPQGISVLCPPTAAAPAPSDASPSSQTPEPTATPTSKIQNSTTSTMTLDSTRILTETRTSPMPSSATAPPSATGDPTTLATAPTPVLTVIASTSTSLSPAEASAQVAAASLCVKGDSSEHGGSLMDTNCSGAAPILSIGSLGLPGLIGLATLASAVLWV